MVTLKSRSKTAYGLLSEIRRLILAEPRRYNQYDWLKTNERGPLAPACGTVGCVGGWTVFLKRDKTNKTAAGILGISSDQGDELFAGDAARSRRDKATGDYSARSIRDHARRGAAHIARFQKKHAVQLRAKRV